MGTTLKRVLMLFAAGMIIAFILTSCVSSQKKLQRRIEKNGIKESISFVVLKYPEYFKTKDTTLIDTIEIHDSIIVPGIEFDAPLRDSLTYWVHNSDSLQVVIDKISGSARVTVPPRIVSITDTIIIETEIPSVPCPDVEALSDNIKTESDSNWLWILAAFGGGLFARDIIQRVRR